MTRRRNLSIAAGVLALGATVAGVAFGDRLAYLAGQAWYQGELLWGRVPLEKAIASGRYTDEEVARLRLVPEIKAYGQRIGLSATDNYDSINPDWDHTIWNISASDPVKFENVRWWFPIVGSMPYLGYFERSDADVLKAELEADGYDVYVRTAGAYSTLGWFRDPLMPGMLKWDEYRLANTILHELAHATVWIPGSVQFNESFANYVGDEAGRAYMIDRYGEGSDEVAKMEERIADADAWRDFMHAVYKDLDAVYADDGLSRDAKLAKKAEILGSLESRVDGVGFRDPAKYREYVAKGDWNNARMMQFRTYNRSRDWFRQLHESQGGDLLAFMERVREVTAGADDPYRALADAVGADFDAE
ncbi:MAG: aminopeptidase [Alphaproteobacteria bacterium]|nr:aminopeptidase [Alphaproteobacteria bacterium]